MENCKNCQDIKQGGIIRFDSQEKCVECGRPRFNQPQSVEGWEVKFKQHISSYEQGDDFNLLSACRVKYGDVALEDFLDSIQDFIRQLLSHQQSEVIEKIKERQKNYTDHICRFNDAPQTCDCYGKALSDIISFLSNNKS